MSQFDLKYRPTSFSQVIGNSGVKKLLLTRSKSHSLADQSMMLSGPKGCGKTTLARIIAKAISCTNLQDGEPCDECVNCTSIINETSQSFQEMDAASQGTVDKIREMVRDADYESMNGMRQVYIVDEAQRLSQAAQEAFLKAIESRLFIVILCTTDPQKVKATIVSRVEEYPIHPPAYEELEARMKSICAAENIEYENEGIELIAKVKENCPRACFLALGTISQLGKITANTVKQYYRFDSYKKIVDILSILDVDPPKSFSILDSLSSEESPTWIRDHIVMAISSSLRVGVGAKSVYPVDIGNFFSLRGRGWADTAVGLSGLDRPSMPDIESVLLRDSRTIMQVSKPKDESVVISESITLPKSEQSQNKSSHINAENIETKSEVSVAKSEASPKLVEASPKLVEASSVDKKLVKQITIEGISFSSNETLTSLDGKLAPTDHTVQNDGNVIEKVQLNADHVPITEKEFSGALLSRLGKH